MKDCLVLVDIQNGFVPDEDAKWLMNLKRLLEAKPFNCVVATGFFNTKGSIYEEWLNWSGLLSEYSQELLGCIKEYVSEVFWKKGYTCFTPEFMKFVEENRIGKLFFAGVDLDCCVLKSAIDSFERNLDCNVIMDCCYSNGGRESEVAAQLVLRRTIGMKRLIDSVQLLSR